MNGGTVVWVRIDASAADRLRRAREDLTSLYAGGAERGITNERRQELLASVLFAADVLGTLAGPFESVTLSGAAESWERECPWLVYSMGRDQIRCTRCNWTLEGARQSSALSDWIASHKKCPAPVPEGGTDG